MKAKSYIKFTLINETDEDSLCNMFVFYLIGIIECIVTVILIGEITPFSIILIILAASLASYLAYCKGCEDAKRRINKRQGGKHHG